MLMRDLKTPAFLCEYQEYLVKVRPTSTNHIFIQLIRVV